MQVPGSAGRPCIPAQYHDKFIGIIKGEIHQVCEYCTCRNRVINDIIVNLFKDHRQRFFFYEDGELANPTDSIVRGINPRTKIFNLQVFAVSENDFDEDEFYGTVLAPESPPVGSRSSTPKSGDNVAMTSPEGSDADT